MGVDRFEVLVHDAKSGQGEKRTWNKAELLKSVGWLKRMNARRYDVFVKPLGGHALVLLNDLSQEKVDDLKAGGFEPALIVEMIPSRFQAWIKLSNRAIAANVLEQAGVGLERKLGCERSNLCHDEFGCLAGFVNYSAKIGGSRQSLYVLANASSGKVSENAANYLRHIEMALVARDVSRQAVDGYKQNNVERSIPSRSER